MTRDKKSEKLNTKENFFVVVSAYNEALRIGKVISQIKKYTDQIIVVDDGSSDKTSDEAKKFKIKVLRHRVNLGKGATMKTGAEAAFAIGAKFILFVDADGQHNPKHIPEFVKQINHGKKIVFGSRNLTFGVPLVRFLGNKFASVLICLVFRIYRSDLLCGFMAMTKETYTKVKWDSARYGVETEIVARTGKNKLEYGEVLIEAIYIDKYKGVTILDAIGILMNIPGWLIS